MNRRSLKLVSSDFQRIVAAEVAPKTTGNRVEGEQPSLCGPEPLNHDCGIILREQDLHENRALHCDKTLMIPGGS